MNGRKTDTPALYAVSENISIVHFKCLGSRYIHKEIKLQKTMNKMDRIVCKMDLILILRHTYKCNTFSDVDFEAFSKSRRPHVGHDNLKIELRVFTIIKSH